MTLLDDTLARITPPDTGAARAAESRLNSLTKPAGSLGYLEEIARRYAALRHDPTARRGRGAVAVFVADHGVAARGVSAYPKDVTVQMLRNIGAGGAAISVLARRFDYLMRVVDVGVEEDTSAAPFNNVVYRRVGPGTRDFLDAAAMSAEQAQRAVEVGIDVARELAGAGATMLGLGEMGIGDPKLFTHFLGKLRSMDIPPYRLIVDRDGLCVGLAVFPDILLKLDVGGFLLLDEGQKGILVETKIRDRQLVVSLTAVVVAFGKKASVSKRQLGPQSWKVKNPQWSCGS